MHYYFHAVVVMSDRKNHRWWNRSKDNIIANILWPFLNGQVIQANYNKKTSLLNLGTAKYLRIFKTETKLLGQELKTFKKNNSTGVECTIDLIKETRLDKASENARSLLEKICLPEKNQVFVVMKFRDKFLNSVYKNTIRPLCEEYGYKVMRIDEIQNSGVITDQIMNALAESAIVLADLTGARPNCYFETGFALATGRELILTIQSSKEPHFNLRQNRFIKWKDVPDLIEKLRERLQDIQDRQATRFVSGNG